MHIRFYLLIMVCFCLATHVSAQEFVLNGMTLQISPSGHLGQVSVTDLNILIKTTSNNQGFFDIKTRIGDTLLFAKDGFSSKKMPVQSQSDMPVYMQQIIKLDEVKVKGQTKQQEINDVMKDYRRNGTFYNGKPPVLSLLSNPITGIYELFGKTPNRARRFAMSARSELEQAEVNRRYNIYFVKQYTLLPTDSLAERFMNYYTSSYEDIMKWNDYDLIKHTQETFEHYKADKNRDRVEALHTPDFIKKDTTLNLSEGIEIKIK